MQSNVVIFIQSCWIISISDDISLACTVRDAIRNLWRARHAMTKNCRWFRLGLLSSNFFRKVFLHHFTATWTVLLFYLKILKILRKSFSWFDSSRWILNLWIFLYNFLFLFYSISNNTFKVLLNDEMLGFLEFLLLVQSSIKWWKEIVEQVLRGETLIFKITIDLIANTVFRYFYIRVNFCNSLKKGILFHLRKKRVHNSPDGSL